MIRELWELDKPTVAAVNGTAVGPGAHLGLACDFVLVHEGTRFLWSFARWGLVVDAGGAYLLPRLVGLPSAKAMVLLGEGATGDGGRPRRPGVQVRPRGRARRDRRHALAARLAAGPTRALGLSKQLLNRSFETDLARRARSRRCVPVACHDERRPRRGHDVVQGEARPSLHRPLGAARRCPRSSPNAEYAVVEAAVCAC